jgi:tetratricopeptide (TPR) repeat protein
VTSIVANGSDPQVAEMAASITEPLVHGLAKIENIRVMAPPAQAKASASLRVPARSEQADFVLSGELQKASGAWVLQSRLTSVISGEVRWSGSASIDIGNTDLPLQRVRLAAGIGHPLAHRLNAMMNSGGGSTSAGSDLPSGKAKVAIEQALASINRTTPERFQAAQAMLEKTIAAEPDNVDLEAALAAHLLRGIQLVWYDPADIEAIERRALSLLDHALRVRPAYLPVLEGYCRFLAATNRFVDGLVACARVASFDPWNGLALYNLGLAEMQLGRFEDALATFEQADRFNTPQVSRWTWMLGAGIACLLLDRNQEASSWLERSIAITPGTGRSHAVLAAAYQRLGRADDAKAAMQKALALRPTLTAANVSLPARNASPVFLDKVQQIIRTQIEAGLPER